MYIPTMHSSSYMYMHVHAHPHMHACTKHLQSHTAFIRIHCVGRLHLVLTTPQHSNLMVICTCYILHITHHYLNISHTYHNIAFTLLYKNICNTTKCLAPCTYSVLVTATLPECILSVIIIIEQDVYLLVHNNKHFLTYVHGETSVNGHFVTS